MKDPYEEWRNQYQERNSRYNFECNIKTAILRALDSGCLSWYDVRWGIIGGIEQAFYELDNMKHLDEFMDALATTLEVTRKQ